MYVLDLRNIQEQVNKAFCLQKNSDLSLFEEIVLVISKFSTFSLKFNYFFSIIRTFFLTVLHKLFGNKIPEQKSLLLIISTNLSAMPRRQLLMKRMQYTPQV